MPQINFNLAFKISIIGLLFFGITSHLLLKSILLESFAISSLSNSEIETIASQVTVRILSGNSSGSGVIIKRQGNIYTVITNRHVLINNETKNYIILTADGKLHHAQQLTSNQSQELDLALLQFQSLVSHRVAELGNSHQLSVGETVYATGFPNWQWLDHNTIKNTSKWGWKAFRLTKGKVSMLPEKMLLEGYQIGYTNDVMAGMSGGAVLNSSGKLIGINGRLKYPLAGIDSFTFVDRTIPSQAVFEKMEALSWAISIESIKLPI